MRSQSSLSVPFLSWSHSNIRSRTPLGQHQIKPSRCITALSNCIGTTQCSIRWDVDSISKPQKQHRPPFSILIPRVSRFSLVAILLFKTCQRNWVTFGGATLRIIEGIDQVGASKILASTAVRMDLTEKCPVESPVQIRGSSPWLGITFVMTSSSFWYKSCS